MNTANLQLEGLYLAIAAINNVLVDKNLLTREEIDLALRRAEQTALGDYRTGELSFSERDAMAFAPRLLWLYTAIFGTRKDGRARPKTNPTTGSSRFRRRARQ